MMNTVYRPAAVPEIPLKEVLRYSGMTVCTDDSLLKKASDIAAACRSCAKGGIVFQKLTVAECNGDSVSFEGFLTLKGSLVSRYLRDCKYAILVLATAGHGVDRFIASRGVMSSLDGLIADASGSALVEAMLDDFCDTVLQNENVKPRISPGYGDFHLENQIEILRCLDAHRTVGVCLNDSLLMSPSKSVSALIGIRKDSHV